MSLVAFKDLMKEAERGGYAVGRAGTLNRFRLLPMPQKPCDRR